VETTCVMGVDYVEAGVFIGKHNITGRQFPFNLLLERNRDNKIVAAFTLNRRRPAHSPLLIPAEVLFTDKELTFRPIRRVPLNLTVDILIDMIEHRLQLPHFRQQALVTIVEQTTTALFNTGIVDVERFLKDAKRPSSQLLKKLPELQDFATEARVHIKAWDDPENIDLLLESLQDSLYRGLKVHWPMRTPLSF
jgi:hypothetical protein